MVVLRKCDDLGSAKGDEETLSLVCTFFERVGAGLLEHCIRVESQLRDEHIKKLEDAGRTLEREYTARGQRIEELESAFRAQEADRDEIAHQHDALKHENNRGDSASKN